MPVGVAERSSKEGVRAMTTLAAGLNSISQWVMKPLEVDVFEAAGERLLRMCDIAHRLGRRALGIEG